MGTLLNLVVGLALERHANAALCTAVACCRLHGGPSIGQKGKSREMLIKAKVEN